MLSQITNYRNNFGVEALRVVLGMLNTLVKSEGNWSFTLLLKSIFTFCSAFASHSLLGERQTYGEENALPNALYKKRKAQTDRDKNAKY